MQNQKLMDQKKFKKLGVDSNKIIAGGGSAGGALAALTGTVSMFDEKTKIKRLVQTKCNGLIQSRGNYVA